MPSPPAPPHTQIPDPNLNILPSNQSAVAGASSSSPTSLSFPISPFPPPNTQSSDAGVGSGPGPIRHPKPLTAAEMHSTLEAEQELLVNRLSKDLMILRAAQNSSVSSNASSTSANASSTFANPSVAGVSDNIGDTHLLSGPNFNGPSPRPHHRTSSTASSRSIGLAAAISSGIGVSSTPSAEPRSPVMGNRPHTVSMSRQSSNASRRSHTESPAPGSFIDPSFSYFQQQRMPLGPPVSGSSMAASTGTAVVSTPVGTGDQLSPGLLPATSRLEEAAIHRAELEAAKRENETLKYRIRELERMLSDRRGEGGASRTRSGSVSTTASVGGVGLGGGPHNPAVGGVAGPRERITTAHSITGSSVGVGVSDEEVKVGESAASAGLKPVFREAPTT